MKWLLLIGIVLLTFLQYKLWFESDNIFDAWQLRKQITVQATKNTSLEARNQQLITSVRALKHEPRAVETRAREELGMVKRDETFYHVIKRKKVKK